MHFRQRGNSWSVVIDIGYDEETGKRKQKWISGKTKKEVKEKAIKILNQVNEGTYIEQSSLTLKDYLKNWLNDYAKTNTAPKTYEGYEHIINIHIIPTIGHLTLDKLKPLHIQKYYTEKLKSGRIDGSGGLSAQSVLHHHRLLKEALQQAVKWQLIVRNTADAVEPPKPDRYEMSILDAEQIKLLLNELNTLMLDENIGYYAPPIIFGIYTGMRRGEILGLREKDINFENKTAAVCQTLQRVDGIGLFFKDPKTPKSRRSVSLSSSLLEMIQKVKLSNAKNKLKAGPVYQDNGLIFCQPNGKPIEPSELGRVFSKLLKQCNLPKVRLHDLRHTHASLMLQQGVHPKIVSERLGHSTIGITLDIYSHVLPNMQEEAVNKLDELITPSRKSL